MCPQYPSRATHLAPLPETPLEASASFAGLPVALAPSSVATPPFPPPPSTAGAETAAWPPRMARAPPGARRRTRTPRAASRGVARGEWLGWGTGDTYDGHSFCKFSFFLPVLYDDTGVLMTTFACTTDNKTMTSRRINNDTPQNDA